jgi:hypothetical protein
VDILSKFTLPGVLLLLTLGFGFWVSRLGKPYNPALFNIHKLLALGAVVLAVIQFTQALNGTLTQAWILILLILAAVCAAALFASGALMSAGKLSYSAMLLVHQAAPVLLVLSLGGALYLLARAAP